MEGEAKKAPGLGRAASASAVGEHFPRSAGTRSMRSADLDESPAMACQPAVVVLRAAATCCCCLLARVLREPCESPPWTGARRGGRTILRR